MSATLERAAKRIVEWKRDPRLFFYEELRMESGDPWLDEFISALPSKDPSKRQIFLKACTGAGKSAALAGANLWFLSTHGGKDGEHPKGVILSIDKANLDGNIWAELSKWQSRSEYLRSAFVWTATKFYAKDFQATWWLEARSWGKKADKEAQGRALSGLHAPYVMATLDECGDMPVSLLRVAQQIFSSQHKYAKILGGGNPTSLDGVLYQTCTNERESTYSLSITADPDDPRRGKRTDIDNAREQIRKYGRTNPWVMATILGQFPPASINALLGIEEVEDAMRRDPRPVAFTWAEKRLGVDCARFGDDRTTLCPRQGLAWRKPVELRAVRTDVIASRIMVACNKWEPANPTSVRILIDQTGGWGQGTVDQLLVAGFSPMDLVYSTPSPDPKYYNLRTYMHFMLAEHVRSSAAIPDIAETRTLRAELTANLYTMREGKLWCIDKDVIKQKLGYSPDLADGYAQTYAIPDMPARSLFQRREAQHAVTDWDVHREIAESPMKRDFDPYRDDV
jgi:phage terminase large subunit